MIHIDEKEDGIVFQFGEAIKSDLPTGLNFKLPIIGSFLYTLMHYFNIK